MAAPRTQASNISQPLPQVRTVADVKANLLRPALTSQFEVYIPLHKIPIRAMNAAGIFLNKNNEWMLNLSCCNANLPGSKLLTSEIKNDRTGVTEHHVHRRMYDDTIDFEFYVPAENYIPIRIFECWMDYAAGVELEDERKDTISSNYFYRMNYPDDYIADQGLKVRKFERDFNQSEANIAGGFLEYEFIRAFPVAITSMPVTYGASDLLEVRVTFSYIRYVMNKGWMQTSNRDPLRLGANFAGELLSGDLRGAWDVLTSGGVPAQVANAAGNAVRSLVTFAFGQEGVDNLRGGARWASSTMSWLGSFGR